MYVTLTTQIAMQGLVHALDIVVSLFFLCVNRNQSQLIIVHLKQLEMYIYIFIVTTQNV